MINLLPSNLKIIGLHGMAGSGKDFIAENCLSPLGYFRFALANHFKIDLIRKGTYTYEEVYVTKPPHVRHGMQDAGTKDGRDTYGEDVWLIAAEAWMYSIHMSNKINKFVIADIRFDNEAEWIKSKGGIMIKLESNRTRFGMDEQAKKHSSEAGVSDHLIDYTVINDDGTDVASLQWQIDSILENMR